MNAASQSFVEADSPQPSDAADALALDSADAGLALGEATYRALSRALREGVFKPGDRLREEEVARRLAVSRTPVREAFGRLLARRLIEPAGGRGLVVRKLELAEALELYALREILEGAAARLAAQHAAPPEVELMRERAAGFERAAQDPRAMERQNRLLHEAIFRAARNRYLDAALRDMQESLALLGPTTFGVAGRPETSVTEHRAIIDAIAMRDAETAERAARDHMRAALKARLRLIGG